MRRRTFATIVLIVAALVAEAAAQPLAAQRTAGVQAVVIEPIPPPIANRYARLQARLQPSARAWLEQQARVRRADTTLNLPALETAIRSRFRILPESPAVDQAVFIVVMMMAAQSARDIPSVAAQVKRLRDAKQKVLRLMSDVQQERAGNPRGNPNLPCRTPLCQSLPDRAHEIASGAAGASHPIRLNAAGPLTWSRLGHIENQLAGASSDLDSFSEIEQLRLQSMMDQRTRIVQTLSTILKKIDATQDSIVASMR